MTSSEYCKGKCHTKCYPYHSYQCDKKAWKDGYCKTHHPDEKIRRNKQIMAEKEKKYLESKIKKK